MSTQPTSLLDGELIDMKFITRFTKLTDKCFYALIQKGEFPEPIKLGRSSRWYKCEVEKWLEKKIRESRK